jgi:hypothetical protein
MKSLFTPSLKTTAARWVKLSVSILFRYVNFIPLFIFIAKFLEVQGVLKFDKADTFVSNFIEWFGVLYGILLPLILVRVWEQLDEIDRQFDREADAVKLLYEDLFYLQGEYAVFGKEISKLLREYVVHVLRFYREEIKTIDSVPPKSDNEIVSKKQYQRIYEWVREQWRGSIQSEGETSELVDARLVGDKILENIRSQYRNLILFARKTAKEPDAFILEIFRGHNEIVDIRGDRIAIASQRLFEGLRVVALIASITFVVPFYFVGFTPNTPLLDNILVVCVTLLVIFTFMIIEDFDEPFGGEWKITDDAWKRVLGYMDEHQQELENLDKKDISPKRGKTGPSNIRKNKRKKLRI